MLEELLKKPESYRKKVAVISTAIIGVVIFTIWLMITHYNIKKSIKLQEQEQKSINEDFEKKLPSLKQEPKKATTELMKKAKNLENN